ncbi:MAG: hypothetical protein HOY78_41530 [Saccharothrix sp.]|nr:hypothetical protein [Saccharothrix sp.]
MNRRRARRRHAALLRDLPAPAPFDARELCRQVAALRRRPIRLLPMTGLDDVCGLWIATDTADLIFHESGTSPPHQDHIVLHELAHLLCDHRSASVTPADLTRVLLPHLDPDVVRRVLGRAAYTTEEEWEAETLASLIRQRDTPATTVTGRLRDALDGGRHG